MSRTNRADLPRERAVLQCVREPQQPAGIEPLRVLQRTDGKFVVYDGARPLGRRTVGQASTLEEAGMLAVRLAAELHAEAAE